MFLAIARESGKIARCNLDIIGQILARSGLTHELELKTRKMIVCGEWLKAENQLVFQKSDNL